MFETELAEKQLHHKIVQEFTYPVIFLQYR